MPSSKPRISFILTEEEHQLVNNFMTQNKIKTQSSAVRAIISMGIEEYKKVMIKGKYQKFDLSPDVVSLVDDYQSLNQHGKKIIRQCLNSAMLLFSEQPISEEGVVQESSSEQE